MVKRAEHIDTLAGDRAVFAAAQLAFALFDRATALEGARDLEDLR